jgi:hypothetical protein
MHNARGADRGVVEHKVSLGKERQVGDDAVDGVIPSLCLPQQDSALVLSERGKWKGFYIGEGICSQ